MFANSRWLLSALCSWFQSFRDCWRKNRNRRCDRSRTPNPSLQCLGMTGAFSRMATRDHFCGLARRFRRLVGRSINGWPTVSRRSYQSKEELSALLSRFDKDGLFADERLNDAKFGPDSRFTTLFIKSGKKQVKMSSWHELMEKSDKLVADHHGAAVLDGRRRLDVLRKTPADYLVLPIRLERNTRQTGRLDPSREHGDRWQAGHESRHALLARTGRYACPSPVMPGEA